MCLEKWAKKITHFFSWDFIRGQLSASSGNEFPLVSFTVSLRVAACVRQEPRIGIRRNVTMIVTPRASILRRHLTSLDSVWEQRQKKKALEKSKGKVGVEKSNQIRKKKKELGEMVELNFFSSEFAIVGIFKVYLYCWHSGRLHRSTWLKTTLP